MSGATRVQSAGQSGAEPSPTSELKDSSRAQPGAEALSQPLGGLSVRLLSRLGIHRERRSRVGVTEALLGGLDVYALLEESSASEVRSRPRLLSSRINPAPNPWRKRCPSRSAASRSASLGRLGVHRERRSRVGVTEALLGGLDVYALL